MNSELQKKVEDALSSEIICFVQFDDDEVEELKNDLMNALDKFNERGNKYFYQSEIKSLIVLMVHYAQSWGDGDESRFWIRILGNIFEKTSFAPNIKFYDEIEKVLKIYDKKIFISPSGKRMLRETLLFHAFAPKISVSAFIKLLFNCCVEEDYINRSYLKDRDIYFRMGQGLKKRFNKETSDMDSDIEFDGNSYSVRSGIKYACIQEENIIVDIIEQIMTSFDSMIFENQDIETSIIGKHVTNTINSYLSQNTTLKKKRTNQKLEPIVSDFSKIYSYYEIIDEKPMLSIPDILIFDDEMTDGTICLYYDNNLIQEKYFDVIGKGFKRKIKKISFDLLHYSNLFVDSIKFRVMVSINGEVVYDSKESVYRKFILLNENVEIKKDCKPGCYYLVYPKDAKVQEITDAQVQGLSKSFASITSVENNYLNYKDKIIFFNTKKLNSHLFFNGAELNNTKLIVGENSYNVFNYVDSINLVLNDYNPNSIIYKINDNNPQSLSSQYVTQKDNQFIISLKNQKLNLKNQISFYDLKTNKFIESQYFAIISKFKVRFDKSFYFSNMIGAVCVYDNGKELFHEKINGSNDEIVFNYNDIGQIVITCPNIKFKIDDGDWFWNCPIKEIWHKSLHSGSVVSIQNNTNLKVNVLKENINLKEVGDNIFLVGDVVTSDSKTDQKINLDIDGNKYNLFSIAFNEKIIGIPELLYENSMIIHDLESKYIGENDTHFQIDFLDENDNIYTYDFKVNELINVNGLKEDYYCYNISSIHEGLYEDTKQLLYTSSDDMIPLGNVLKLEYNDSYIKVLTTKTPLKKVKFDNCYIDNIEYKEEDFYPIYTGILHCQKLRINIEFERKDDNTIKIYISNNNSLKLINVDIKENKFTTNSFDNKTIFESFSCYYKKESK